MSAGIRTKRAALSIGERVEEVTRGRVEEDSPDALAAAVVDFALVIASEKVNNGLRNAGLGLEDGTLSAESIRAALSRKIGAEITDLSPEGLASALNQRLSNEVAELLGVEGVNLFEGGSLEEQAKQLALQAIASGRPSKLVSAGLMRDLKRSAAYLAAGIDVSEGKDAVNRAKQRRHRTRYRQIWT